MISGPLYEMMGYEVVKVDGGTVHARVSFNEDLADGRGALHKGVLVVLADTAFGAATFSQMNKLAPIATLDLRVDYARPIPAGHGLEAQVECHYAGEFSSHLNGVILAVDNGEITDTVVARVTGIFAKNTPGLPVFNSVNATEVLN